MREIRTSGSEGGGGLTASPYPYHDGGLGLQPRLLDGSSRPEDLWDCEGVLDGTRSWARLEPGPSRPWRDDPHDGGLGLQPRLLDGSSRPEDLWDCQ